MRTIPASSLITVTTRCWSCEEPMHKRVSARHRHHRHFAWACEHCDVTWCGPGDEVPAAKEFARR